MTSNLAETKARGFRTSVQVQLHNEADMAPEALPGLRGTIDHPLNFYPLFPCAFSLSLSRSSSPSHALLAAACNTHVISLYRSWPSPSPSLDSYRPLDFAELLERLVVRSCAALWVGTADSGKDVAVSGV